MGLQRLKCNIWHGLLANSSFSRTLFFSQILFCVVCHHNLRAQIDPDPSFFYKATSPETKFDAGDGINGSGIRNTGLDAISVTISGTPYILKATVWDGTQPGIALELIGKSGNSSETDMTIGKQIFKADLDPYIIYESGQTNLLEFGMDDPDVILGKKGDQIYMVVVCLRPNPTLKNSIVVYQRFMIDFPTGSAAPYQLTAKRMDCVPQINLPGNFPPNYNPSEQRYGYLGVSWEANINDTEIEQAISNGTLFKFSGMSCGRTCYNPNIDANHDNGEVVITWSEKEDYIQAVRIQVWRGLFKEHASIRSRGNVYGAIGFIETGCFGSTCQGSSSCRPLIKHDFSYLPEIEKNSIPNPNPVNEKQEEVEGKGREDRGQFNCIKYLVDGTGQTSAFFSEIYYDPSFGDAIGVDNELERKSRNIFTSSPDVALSESSNDGYKNRENDGNVGVISYIFNSTLGLTLDQRYHNYLGYQGGTPCVNVDGSFNSVLKVDDVVPYQDVESTPNPWVDRRFNNFIGSYATKARISAIPRKYGTVLLPDPSQNRNFLAVQSAASGGCDDEGFYTYAPIKVFGRRSEYVSTFGQIINDFPDITDRRNYDVAISYAPDIYDASTANVAWSVFVGPGGTDVISKQFSVNAPEVPQLLSPVVSYQNNGYSVANFITPKISSSYPVDADPNSKTRIDANVSVAGRHINSTIYPVKTPNCQLSWGADRKEIRSRSSYSKPGTEQLKNIKPSDNTSNVHPKLIGNMLQLNGKKGEVWQLIGSDKKVLKRIVLSTDKQSMRLTSSILKKVMSAKNNSGLSYTLK